MHAENKESLLQFPCDFPIKAVGSNMLDLQHTVLALVRKHAPQTDARRMKLQPSRNGRYLSVTISIAAESRAQLDAIYRELHAHPDVLMVL